MSHGISVIAIDGPVAAGKTVVGRQVAQRLGFKYLDTGVMYRGVTWLALRCAVPVEDTNALGELARNHPIRLKGQDSDIVLIGRHEVGPELREPQIDRNVSQVSLIPEVRVALVAQQQALAEEGNIVMVGRDIGTVVLPKADLKIFLTASVEERARRRWQDLVRQGHGVDYQQVIQDTRHRDAMDSQRAMSPLIPAGDAIQLNTDGLTTDQVIEAILSQARQHTGKPQP